MAQSESITLPLGKVTRRYAPVISPTLLALPESERPTPALGCTSCPVGSWYLDEDGLACHCAARRYVSWLPKHKAIILCDDREQAFADEDSRDAEGEEIC